MRWRSSVLKESLFSRGRPSRDITTKGEAFEPVAELKSRALNGWGLFWSVSFFLSVVMAVAMLKTDLTTGEGVSQMIGFSVRWAVPFIYLVIATSSLQILFPCGFSRWLLRNRKYIGLCFAVAMAWQGLFIFMMSNYHRPFYYEEIYLLRDELEGSVGYIFLTAMVITSFRFGRRYLDSRQWKLLHKSGVYFLWAYAFSVYWWALFYYGNPQPFEYLFYWGGFIAFALRIAAWGKIRLKDSKKAGPENRTPPVLKAMGVALIASGLLVSASGHYWQETVTATLTAPEWSANLVLWLPFWPFEPYFSLFIMAVGTLLMTKTGAAKP